jgi:2-dehydro-3-deoxygalactonokinase
MKHLPREPAIALDGGTTNTRARLVLDGRVAATARRAVGVRNAVLDDGGRPLAGAVRDAIEEVCHAAAIDEPELIVAAGMMTSEVGLATVPHVLAPAGVDELARAARTIVVPEVSAHPILFVPGVRTPAATGDAGWLAADVMRGEECETLGALVRLATETPWTAGAFLWPGSHTKLVEVDRGGRIVRSHTTLAGELTEALGRHTLLSASLPAAWPDDPDPTALRAGARAVAAHGLGRAAFLVRIAALTSALDPHERASFLIGAVVADDVAQLAGHPILAGSTRVWVGGRQPQRRLYAAWLGERHPGPVSALDDDVCDSASALGALAVARRYREIGTSE